MQKTPYRFAWLWLLLLGGVFCHGTAFAQSGAGAAPGTATLRVSGEVSQPLSLTVETWKNSKRRN